jgi:Fe2+ transport system protein B
MKVCITQRQNDHHEEGHSTVKSEGAHTETVQQREHRRIAKRAKKQTKTKHLQLERLVERNHSHIAEEWSVATAFLTLLMLSGQLHDTVGIQLSERLLIVASHS